MNSESLRNVLTRQWRIVAGSQTVNPRNRMPETGASGSVGAPLEESGALPGNLHPALNQSGLATKVEITSRHHASHSCLLNAIVVLSLGSSLSSRSPHQEQTSA